MGFFGFMKCFFFLTISPLIVFARVLIVGPFDYEAPVENGTGGVSITAKGYSNEVAFLKVCDGA